MQMRKRCDEKNRDVGDREGQQAKGSKEYRNPLEAKEVGKWTLPESAERTIHVDTLILAQ